MIVEIRQAGFVNKGAELMLIAIVKKLRDRYPDVKITMAPIWGGADNTFDKMRKLDLYPRAWLWRHGVNFELLANFIPKRILSLYGLILSKDVDVVIDAAGFCYSDQWGNNSSRELSSSSARWNKNGTKLIMLPQAFGPFKKNGIEKYVRKWARNADLIFPREKDSYKHLTDLVGEQDKIKLYPDFTNLVEGTLPEGYNSTDKKVAIVPNYRMIDKTSKAEGDAYLPFLIKCASYLSSKGAKPFLLVHEGKDDYILSKTVSEAAGGIPIVEESNPLHIKGILGSCDATVGSRFHGLVSALSQGVPSLATGWSHKYQRLFEDYEFVEGLVSVTDSDKVLYDKLDLITSLNSAKSIRSDLESKSKELKNISEEMWNLVFSVIDEIYVKTH